MGTRSKNPKWLKDAKERDGWGMKKRERLQRGYKKFMALIERGLRNLKD